MFVTTTFVATVIVSETARPNLRGWKRRKRHEEKNVDTLVRPRSTTKTASIAPPVPPMGFEPMLERV
jgi:hypothetical protein